MDKDTCTCYRYTQQNYEHDVELVKKHWNRKKFTCLQLSENVKGTYWDLVEGETEWRTMYKEINGEKTKVMLMTGIVCILRFLYGRNCTEVIVSDRIGPIIAPEIPFDEQVNRFFDADISYSLCVSLVIRNQDADSYLKTYIYSQGAQFDIRSCFGSIGDLVEIGFQPLYNIPSGKIQLSILSMKEVALFPNKIIGKFNVDRLLKIIKRWKLYAEIQKMRRAQLQKMAVYLYHSPDFEYKGETYHGKGFLKGMKRFLSKQKQG